MSTKTLFKFAEDMQKTHDLIGNGQKIYDHVKTFKDAASDCLKVAKADPKDPKALTAVADIRDKQTEALIKHMTKLAKQAEEMSKVDFPVIDKYLIESRSKWMAAIYKHGDDSKQALSMRKYHLKELKTYKGRVGEQINFCNATLAVADRNIALYRDVDSVSQAGLDIALKLLALPELPQARHHVAAAKVLMKHQTIPATARAVARGYEALKPSIRAKLKVAEAEAKNTDYWIRDMAKKDLSKFLKDALKKSGIKL